MGRGRGHVPLSSESSSCSSLAPAADPPSSSPLSSSSLRPFLFLRTLCLAGPPVVSSAWRKKNTEKKQHGQNTLSEHLLWPAEQIIHLIPTGKKFTYNGVPSMQAHGTKNKAGLAQIISPSQTKHRYHRLLWERKVARKVEDFLQLLVGNFCL